MNCGVLAWSFWIIVKMLNFISGLLQIYQQFFGFILNSWQSEHLFHLFAALVLLTLISCTCAFNCTETEKETCDACPPGQFANDCKYYSEDLGIVIGPSDRASCLRIPQFIVPLQLYLSVAVVQFLDSVWPRGAPCVQLVSTKMNPAR